MRKLSFLLLVASFSIIFLLGFQNKVKAEETYVLFWGIDCEHCERVLTEIDDQNLDEKINIIKKEIFQNEANAEEFEKATKDCGLSEAESGVPLMFKEGNCYIGTEEVIAELENTLFLGNTTTTPILTTERVNNPNATIEFEQTDVETDKRTEYIYLFFGGILITIVIGYIIYLNQRAEK